MSDSYVIQHEKQCLRIKIILNNKKQMCHLKHLQSLVFCSRAKGRYRLQRLPVFTGRRHGWYSRVVKRYLCAPVNTGCIHGQCGPAPVITGVQNDIRVGHPCTPAVNTASVPSLGRNSNNYLLSTTYRHFSVLIYRLRRHFKN